MRSACTLLTRLLAYCLLAVLLLSTDIVREYRKLDDQVVTRLNRAAAQLRDEERLGKGGSPEGMCAQMWAEMMGEYGIGNGR